ncbi:MAG: phosphoglycerate kinase, partial [Patescibacteria group bacterium]
PSYAGLLFDEEVRSLESGFAPQHPFLLILGGVKFESKIGVIDRFLNIADKIFIGGALANNFFKARGDNIGESVFDSRISVGKYLDNEKIILPVDVRKKSDKIFDIGPKTVENLVELIKKEKFILWNGPPGNIEEGFGESTKIVAEAIANSGAKSIVGGGDTVAIINKMGLIDKFSFVSTGGGAMLQFLAYGTLPGIEALKNK